MTDTKFNLEGIRPEFRDEIIQFQLEEAARVIEVLRLKAENRKLREDLIGLQQAEAVRPVVEAENERLLAEVERLHEELEAARKIVPPPSKLWRR